MVDRSSIAQNWPRWRRKRTGAGGWGLSEFAPIRKIRGRIGSPHLSAWERLVTMATPFRFAPGGFAMNQLLRLSLAFCLLFVPAFLPASAAPLPTATPGAGGA